MNVGTARAIVRSLPVLIKTGEEVAGKVVKFLWRDGRKIAAGGAKQGTKTECKAEKMAKRSSESAMTQLEAQGEQAKMQMTLKVSPKKVSKQGSGTAAKIKSEEQAVLELLTGKNICSGIPSANVNVLKSVIENYKSDPKKLAEIRKILEESKTVEDRLSRLNQFFKSNPSGWKDTVLITKDSLNPANPQMWANIKPDCYYVTIDEQGKAIAMQFDPKMLAAARNPGKGDQTPAMLEAVYHSLCSAATTGKHIGFCSGAGGKFVEIRPLGDFGNKRLLGKLSSDGVYIFKEWELYSHKEAKLIFNGK